MPIYEYKCRLGHLTEKIILNINLEPDDNTECCECDETAELIQSLTGRPWSGTFGPLRNRLDPTKVIKKLMPEKKVTW